jgi:hypothetical protein
LFGGVSIKSYGDGRSYIWVIWTIFMNHVKNLNVYFNKLIKQIQHLPERTANAGALLLLGQIPIEGQIHKRMLCTFRNVIANTNTFT